MLIKMKLLELNKKQVDLLDELRNRGIDTRPSELSMIINNRLNTPKAERVRKECFKILDEWASIGQSSM